MAEWQTLKFLREHRLQTLELIRIHRLPVVVNGRLVT